MRIERIALLNSGRRGCMDVAAALAMANGSEIGKLILMGRAADDWVSIFKLRDIIELSIDPRYKKYANGLAIVIANEIVFINYCRECHGTGKKYVYKQEWREVKLDVTVCDNCLARGWHWFPNRYRARLGDITWGTWRYNGLGDIVEAYTYELEKLAGEAEKHLSKQ